MDNYVDTVDKTWDNLFKKGIFVHKEDFSKGYPQYPQLFPHRLNALLSFPFGKSFFSIFKNFCCFFFFSIKKGCKKAAKSFVFLPISPLVFRIPMTAPVFFGVCRKEEGMLRFRSPLPTFRKRKGSRGSFEKFLPICGRKLSVFCREYAFFIVCISVLSLYHGQLQFIFSPPHSLFLLP